MTLEEQVARAALDAFDGDDEVMADAMMAAPEHTLSAIARAIIPMVLDRAAKVAERRHEQWRLPHPDDAQEGEVCCDVTACADIAAAIRAIGAP